MLEAVLLLLCLAFVPPLARATTRMRRHLAELEHAATHDDLTSLLNRAGFQREVERQLARPRTPGAIVLVDIEGFSAVNDLLGSQSADALLSEVTARLPTDLRNCDALARLGEDEFGLFLRSADRVDIAIAAEGVQGALGPQVTVDGVSLAMSVSIGAALFPEHGDDFATLLRRAGTALSRAREKGAGTVEIYEPSHEASGAASIASASELRDALARGELEMHYQPLVDVATRNVRGAEALIRWQHPERGLLPAHAFVAQAEQGGSRATCAASCSRPWPNSGARGRPTVSSSSSP